MNAPFMELRGLPEKRPVIEVRVEGLREFGLRAMVDSGSLSSLFGSWVAREANIELDGAREARLGVAGVVTTARFATVRLFAGRHTWEAEVGFCDPWPFDHGLLGLEGFFRWFDVTISVASQRTVLTPID